MRIATILYLVSLVFQQMTGASAYACILMGGLAITVYAVLGGARGIVCPVFPGVSPLVWFHRAFLTVIRGIEGGSPPCSGSAGPMTSSCWATNAATGAIEPVAWFSLRVKAIIMMLIRGLAGWIFEYSANQDVVQKYVSAKDPKAAFKSIWICCLCSVPTWAFFMFLGTALYVFFLQHPDPQAQAILTGAGGAKAESILPYFCVKMVPTGLAGIVIAASWPPPWPPPRRPSAAFRRSSSPTSTAATSRNRPANGTMSRPRARLRPRRAC